MSWPARATARVMFAVVLLATGARARASAEVGASPQPSPAPPPAPAPAPLPVPAGEPSAPNATPSTAPPAVPTLVDPTEKLRFRHTWLVFSNAVNAQTLGVGHSYQSSNPTYEMSGSFQPRYYLYDGEREVIFTEGRLDVIHEFTNSDVTTDRGETTLSDAQILTGYAKQLALHGDYATVVSVRAPELTLPTSKFSYDNGTILGLGADVRLSQALPLAGDGASVFQRMILRGFAGYNHTFTRAVVPTDPELRRVRLDPEGRTVPGDQLTGAAFPEHEIILGARALVDITNTLGLWFEVQDHPIWKYGFGDVCITTLTGCSNALQANSPNRFVVLTAFQAEVDFDVLPKEGISLDLGYLNVETQPGLDGQRRSIFSSPGAQIYLDVVGYLDQLYVFGKGEAGEESPTGHHLRL